jgi:hypothetical protein
MSKALGCICPKLSSVVCPPCGVPFFFCHQITDILAWVSFRFGGLNQIFYLKNQGNLS